MFIFFGRFVRLFSVGYAGGSYLLLKIRFWIFFGLEINFECDCWKRGEKWRK